MRIQKTISEDSIAKLTNEVNEVKNENRERLTQLEDKIRKAEIEKAEVSAKEQAQREAYQQMVTENNRRLEEQKLKINQ